MILLTARVPLTASPHTLRDELLLYEAQQKGQKWSLFATFRGGRCCF